MHHPPDSRPHARPSKVMEPPSSGGGHGGRAEAEADPVSSSSLRWGPRRGGPYPHLRLDFGVKVDEGMRVVELVLGEGRSFRQAAAALGLSVSTCWRRYHFVLDWLLPEQYGLRSRRLPPQRGTRACPRGRPWIQELDGPGGPLAQEGIER